MDERSPGARTRVRRLPKRGVYDLDTIRRILDEGVVCHVGVVDDGGPVVIPTAYARDGDRLLIHGSTASRLMRALSSGAPACIVVTHVDGLVLARSVFHHSMNYRSVVIFATARPIEERGAKLEALRALVEHLVPGRWDDAREPNESELDATAVVELPLDEASAKMRSGPPADEDEDYGLPVWAGVLPLETVVRPPVPDERLPAGVEAPEYVTRYARAKR